MHLSSRLSSCLFCCASPFNRSQMTSCDVAWAERLTPLNEENKACHLCLVPGCMKLWDVPVTARAVRFHVESAHPGMQLRWTHERRRLTDAEQLEHVRASGRRHYAKKRLAEEMADLGRGQGGRAVPITGAAWTGQYPGGPAVMPPPTAAVGNTWTAMGFAPPFLAGGLPSSFALPPSTPPPRSTPHSSSTQLTPQAAGPFLSSPMQPAFPAAPLMAPACPLPPSTAPPAPPCTPPAPPARQAVSHHRPARRTTDTQQRLPRVRTRGAPSKQALANDPDGASLLGSLFCDSTSTAITARYVREHNVVVGAGVEQIGLLKGVGVAYTYEAWLRGPGTYAGDEAIVLCGNRQDDVPVPLRVATLWLKYNLADVWTRLRCPGPLITDAYGGELPPMIIEQRPLGHVTEGMSMTLALALAMVSRVTGCPVRKGVGVTGSLDISGRLCKVISVESKAKGMREAGVTTIICPFGSEHPGLVSGLKYEVCRHIMEVLDKALVPHAANPPAPVVGLATYRAGWLGTATTLSHGAEVGPDSEEVKANVDTVIGEVQVVECLVSVGGEGLDVELLEEPGDEEGTGSEDMATSSVSYVTTALATGRIRPNALPVWPLPPGQHLKITFNPSAGEKTVRSGGFAHAAMTTALVSALTGRPARPGTAIVGEHDWRGNLLPTISASRVDARVVEDVAEEVQRVLCHTSAAAKLRSVLRREGGGQLQRRQVSVVGVENMGELMEEALLPLVGGGEVEE